MNSGLVKISVRNIIDNNDLLTSSSPSTSSVDTKVLSPLIEEKLFYWGSLTVMNVAREGKGESSIPGIVTCLICDSLA